MYLSYDEYQAMGGTLSENIFDDYCFRAEALVNYATFNRLKKEAEIPDVVKRLIKYIIDMVQKRADSLSLGNSLDSSSNAPNSIYITSQSNDGVSATYSGMASTDLFSLCDDEIKKSINLYLDGVMNEAGRKLLYRGLYPGE